MATVDRADVLGFRMRRHQLDLGPAALRAATDVELLDYGVQDSGPDGAAWALAVRGAPLASRDDLFFAWTLRGAPHAYRRGDVAAVAVATSPYSEGDAAKRIFDAAKPLRDAGIAVLDALRLVAERLRELAARPIVKGEASSRLAEILEEPFLRFCRACDAIHIYEQPFRLAALQGGLELEPGTSPPVLRRIPRLRPPLYDKTAAAADQRTDVIRNYLRFYGPARVADAAVFIDAPVKEVKSHWPEDTVQVAVKDERAAHRDARWALEDDVEELSGGTTSGAVRLLGPFDPYLQLRDRGLLVEDQGRQKELWRTIGRPGAVIVDGEVAATWRPRTKGKQLSLQLEPWRKLTKKEAAALREEAERLAGHRGVALGKIDP
jgi:hypothetical protein